MQQIGGLWEASFIHKCTQLWETIMVRHGLMVVGGGPLRSAMGRLDFRKHFAHFGPVVLAKFV